MTNSTAVCRRVDCYVPSAPGSPYCSIACVLLGLNDALLTARLKAVRELTEAALADRDDMPVAILDEAINWGDLQPSEVRLCISGHGILTYQVDIEEASPHATALQAWVRARIANALPDLDGEVEVRTEW